MHLMLVSPLVPLRCWSRSMETPHAVWTNARRGALWWKKNYGLARKKKQPFNIFQSFLELPKLDFEVCYLWTCDYRNCAKRLDKAKLRGYSSQMWGSTKSKLSASFCRGVIFNDLAGHLYKLELLGKGAICPHGVCIIACLSCFSIFLCSLMFVDVHWFMFDHVYILTW